MLVVAWRGVPPCLRCESPYVKIPLIYVFDGVKRGMVAWSASRQSRRPQAAKQAAGGVVCPPQPVQERRQSIYAIALGIDGGDSSVEGVCGSRVRRDRCVVMRWSTVACRRQEKESGAMKGGGMLKREGGEKQ